MTSQPPAPAAPVDAPPPTSRSAVAPTRRRLDGVDAARALAIIGMVSVHVAAPLGGAYSAGDVAWYAALPYGRASATFAFVAGLGIALATRRRTWLESASQLLWRAAWLAPLGIVLGYLGTPVAVILQYYALWFALAVLFVKAPTWLVATVTAVGVIVGPTLLVVAEVARPEWYSPRGSGAWLGVFGDLLLTGYYPTVSWLWLVLAGMLVARTLDLGDRGVAAGLTLVGAGVAAAAYVLADVLRGAVDLGEYQGWFDTVGHSDTPLETIAVGGVAAAVVGVCLLLADVARPLVLPLAMLGRLALTVYVGHIVAYAVLREQFLSYTVGEVVTTTAWITLVSTAFAVAWLAVFRRGPLEAVDRAGFEHVVTPIVDAVLPQHDPARPAPDRWSPTSTATPPRRAGTTAVPPPPVRDAPSPPPEG